MIQIIALISAALVSLVSAQGASVMGASIKEVRFSAGCPKDTYAVLKYDPTKDTDLSKESKGHSIQLIYPKGRWVDTNGAECKAFINLNTPAQATKISFYSVYFNVQSSSLPQSDSAYKIYSDLNMEQSKLTSNSLSLKNGQSLNNQGILFQLWSPWCHPSKEVAFMEIGSKVELQGNAAVLLSGEEYWITFLKC
jgi:hypothetical protein